MPSVVTAGIVAVSADPVANPTALAPGLPTRTTGQALLCFTASTSTTATVAASAGWASLFNVVGTFGRIALFGDVTDGAEVAPTITWTGLTTGTTGTPCTARIINMDTGFYDIAGVLQVDVLGAVSNQATSATVIAAGAGITTLTDSAIVFSATVWRTVPDAALTETGTGLAWTTVASQQTTSGADMTTIESWGIKTPAGVIGNHTYTLTGAASGASSGVLVALLPTPPPVDTVPAPLTYTKSPVRMRSSY